jgi:hypothetical protein
MWLIVFARGLMGGPAAFVEMEFLRTRAEELGGKPVVLSRRALRGREEVAPAACNFC